MGPVHADSLREEYRCNRSVTSRTRYRHTSRSSSRLASAHRSHGSQHHGTPLSSFMDRTLFLPASPARTRNAARVLEPPPQEHPSSQPRAPCAGLLYFFTLRRLKISICCRRSFASARVVYVPRRRVLSSESTTYFLPIFLIIVFIEVSKN